MNWFSVWTAGDNAEADKKEGAEMDALLWEGQSDAVPPSYTLVISDEFTRTWLIFNLTLVSNKQWLHMFTDYLIIYEIKYSLSVMWYTESNM